MVVFDDHSKQVMRLYVLWLLSTAALVYCTMTIATWSWDPAAWPQGARAAAAVLWSLVGCLATLVAIIECTTSDEKVRTNA